MNLSLTGLILDAIILVILFLFIKKAMDKGFISSLVQLVGSILAAVFSGYFSSAIADFVYENYIRSTMVNNLMTGLTEMTGGTDWAASLGEILEEIPGILSWMVEDKLWTLSEDVRQGLYQGSVGIAESLVDSMVKPLLVSLMTMILFLIIFAVLSFLVRMVSKALNIVVDIPFIGGINRLLGGVLGFLQGILILLIFACAVSVFISLTGGENGMVNYSVIDGSLLFRQLYNHNPFIIA